MSYGLGAEEPWSADGSVSTWGNSWSQGLWVQISSWLKVRIPCFATSPLPTLVTIVSTACPLAAPPLLFLLSSFSPRKLATILSHSQPQEVEEVRRAIGNNLIDRNEVRKKRQGPAIHAEEALLEKEPPAVIIALRNGRAVARGAAGCKPESAILVHSTQPQPTLRT